MSRSNQALAKLFVQTGWIVRLAARLLVLGELKGLLEGLVRALDVAEFGARGELL